MSLDNFAMATVEELTLDVGLVTGGECLGYPAPGLISGPRPSALKKFSASSISSYPKSNHYDYVHITFNGVWVI